ncbi:MAG: hypothetical protein AAB969_01690 [Patescibacteria group bacterium]
MNIILGLVFIFVVGILIGRGIYIGQPKYIDAMKGSDVYEVLTKWKNKNYYLAILKSVHSQKIDLWRLEHMPNSQFIKNDRICNGEVFITSA